MKSLFILVAAILMLGLAFDADPPAPTVIEIEPIEMLQAYNVKDVVQTETNLLTVAGAITADMVWSDQPSAEPTMIRTEHERFDGFERSTGPVSSTLVFTASYVDRTRLRAPWERDDRRYDVLLELPTA